MTAPSLTGRPLTVLLRNVSGGDLDAGLTVILATSADAAIDLTTAVADYRALGVLTALTPDGERGRVQIAGTVLARVSGVVARGDYLQTSTTPGNLGSTGTSADAGTPPPAGSCAIALEDGTAGSLVLVEFIGPTPPAGSGGGGSYTDEQAQDAVGGILFDTAEINFTYNDAGPGITAALYDDSVVASRLHLTAPRLIGRSVAGAGPGEEIAIGAGLTLAGGTLSATGGGGGLDAEGAQDAVGGILADSAEVDFTYDDATPSISAVLRTNSVVVSRLTMATARLVGRTTAGAGAGEEIGIGTGLALAGGVLSATAASFPGFANPTVQVTLAVQNGVAGTAMRSDAAPSLSQAIVPTWTGVHTWTNRTAWTGTFTPTGVANDYIHHYSDQIIAPLTNDNQFHNWLSPLFEPGAGRTIPAVVVEQIILRTGSGAGAINQAQGISVQASYGTQKPTGTVIGIAVQNMGTTGVGQTQAIGIKAQTGVAAFGLVSEGGENRMVGHTVFNNLSAGVAPIQLAGTVPDLYGYLGEALYPTGGNLIRPIWVTSTFAPTSNLNYSIGASITPTVSPPTGVTISNVWTIQATLITGNSGGTISDGVAFIAMSSYGSIKPPTTAGINVWNMGASGITTSIGLKIEAQSGSVTNIAIQSLGGEHRFVGPTTLGANQAPNAGYMLDIVAGKLRLASSLTLTIPLDAAVVLTPAITANTNPNIGGLLVGPVFSGNADSPIGLLVRPYFQPSAPITDALSASLAGVHNGGVIGGDLVGFRPIVGSFANTGSVNNLKAIRVDSPVYTGTARAVNAYGIQIQSQYNAAHTINVALQIENQTPGIALRSLGGQNRFVGGTTFGADAAPNANAPISLVSAAGLPWAFNVSGPAVIAGDKTGSTKDVYIAVGMNGNIRYIQTYI